MSTIAPDTASDRSRGVGFDIAGLFSFLFDPPGAAQRLDRKWFWIWPALFGTIVMITYMVVSGPLLQDYILNRAPTRPNMTPEQQAHISALFYTVLMYAAPVVILITDVIVAAVLFATAAVFAVKASFLRFFNLAAGCGVIVGIQSIVWTIILKAKGEIQTQAEIRPPLGLDIILPDSTNKVVMGIASYFSLFQIWYIVMLILVLSAGYRISKGKATGIVTPLVVIGLFFSIIGAIFQR